MKVRSRSCELKSVVADENCELVYDKIFCANAKISSLEDRGTSSAVYFCIFKGWLLILALILA
jgi:hypothetical protein